MKDFMFSKRAIPEIWSLGIPDADEKRLDILVNSFDLMNHYLDSFSSALALFDFADAELKSAEQVVYRHSQFIAARDGAISIYNFQKAVEAIIHVVKISPFYAANIDGNALKAVFEKFKLWFPDAAAVRHSVGHASEKIENEKEHQAHGYTGLLNVPGIELEQVKDFLVVDHLEGRTLYNTWKKKIVHYTIGQESLSRLKVVRDETFDLFDIRVKKAAAESA